MKQVAMKYVSVLVVGLAAAACTAPNPDFCDSNDDCGGDVCNLDLNRCEPASDASVGPDGAVLFDASPGTDAPEADAGPNPDAAIERFTVTITPAGAGGGTVTSSPEGIDCGATCTAEYVAGTEITLVGAADGLSTFDGWSGAGCTGTAPCVFTLDADVDVTATFGQQEHLLTVSASGDGTGTISSAPGGIDCGGDCSESYTAGTLVTLTATPTSPATFGGWSGACSGLATTCEVTMDAARTVGAAFDLGTVSVSVSLAGTGGGSVSSNVGDIACPGTCSDSYTIGATVILTAVPDATSSFTGWSGAGCSGTGTCSVSATVARSVTATFTRDTHTLTVVRAGTGGGTVTSAPAGIDCGSDCSEVYEEPTVVTLIASRDANSEFDGWSGACAAAGTSLTCMVTMDAAKTATATFSPTQRTLTVTTGGGGSGVVTSNPAGINCGSDCTEQYDHGESVLLTPMAVAGSSFTGWSGSCSGTDPCTLIMNGDRAATATFQPIPRDLTVTVAGSGGGTVTSAPSGINCPGDCTETYDDGEVVTLTATADGISTFTGWSGSGCSGTGDCVVTMSAARSVTATFALIQRTLSVSVTGTGAGTVTGTGISCPGDCSQAFDHGVTVTLSQAATTGFFTGWSGACSGTGACAPVMTANRSVTANFDECRDSNDCGGTAPVCTAAECVGCGSNAQCEALDPAAPICSGSGACEPCIDHIQCDSGVCNIDAGSCIDEGEIVYVDSSGSTAGTCGSAGLPCRTITLGVTKLTPSRTYLKLDSDTYSAEGNTIVFDGITANIIAPGAILDQTSSVGIIGFRAINAAVVHVDSLEIRNSPSTGIETRSGSSVELFRVTVRDNPIGVSNFDSTMVLDQTLVTGGNTTLSTACLVSPCTANLSVSRSTFTDTGSRGLLLTDGVFSIDNTMIIDNDVSSGVNALIEIGDGATGTIDFTTIAGNDMAGSIDGLRCATGAGAVAVSNSIFYDNSFGDDAIAGTCFSWTFSNIENRVALGVTGTGNIDSNPLYVSPGTGNYRLQSGSPARNFADPSTTVVIDFDGQPRPEGGRADMGADEFHP